MSLSGILQVLDTNGVPTGNLVMYYDFSNLTQQGVEESGLLYDLLSNDSLLGPEYSGKIYYTGSNATFAGKESFIDEYGFPFFGGALNSGDLLPNKNFIQIQNTNGLSEQEFTFVVLGGLKKGYFFPSIFDGTVYTGTSPTLLPNSSGHVYDRYPFFSNRESGEFCADGWEIGLTNSNRLYFECIDPYALQPISFTTRSVAAFENIWAIRYNTSSVDIGRYDLFDEEFKYETAQLNGLLNGQTWTIGSGLGGLNNLVGTGSYDSDTLLGTIRNFMYFSSSLSDDTLNEVAKVICGDCTSGSDSYENYSAATGVTGSGISYITGITGYSYIQVEPTGEINENFTYFQLLTGNVASGTEYFVPYTSILGDGTDYANGQDVIYQELVNTGSTITGITGFNVITGTTGLSTGDWDYYTLSPLTGVIGEVIELLYGSGSGNFLVSEGEISCQAVYPEYLLPHSRTYLHERYSTGDFVENQSGVLQTGDYYVNKRANISNSRIFPGSTPFFREANDQELCNLFIGGIGRFGSGIIVGEEEKIIVEYISGDSYYIRDCGGGEVITSAQISEVIRTAREAQYMLLGDWYLTGLEVIESLPFTGIESELVNSTYDRAQSGTRRVFPITGYDSHTGMAGYNIPELFEDIIMFNGQKIVSGEHFTGNFNGSYTEFHPFGWITGETGAYFTFPKYTGVTTWTGLQEYDFDGEAFWPQSFVTWINGVRVTNNAFVEHDTRADLITGYEVWVDNLLNIYNSD